MGGVIIEINVLSVSLIIGIVGFISLFKKLLLGNSLCLSQGNGIYGF